MNKTAGVSLVRRVVVGALVAVSLTSSFVASAAWNAGLQEGSALTPLADATTAEPTSWTSVMSPIVAGVSGWGANKVFVYRGQIYLDGTKHWFCEKNWLWVWLKIDGEVLLNNDQWYVLTTGSITREAGWYDFEARFWSDPNDSLGPAGSTVDKNGRSCGFGYARGDTAPADMTACVYPEDNGSMSLFRYDDGTGFPGVNVFGDPEDLGEPNPGYGLHEDVTVSTPYVLECPEYATNVSATIAYRCAGWELKVNDALVATSTPENLTTCTYTCTNAPDKAVVTWKWVVEKYKLDVDVDGEGSVDVESQWVDSGAAITLTATPAAGMKFWKWTGEGIEAADTYRPSVTVTMSKSRTMTANFYDPAANPRIIRYVKPTATGAGGGTSWADACGDLATAYNEVMANPTGGEVWLAKGRHALDTALALVPNVSVRGGFAGDETLASQADPKSNPTILSLTTYKRSTDTWKDATLMWSGDDMLTFVEPNDYGDADIQFDSSNDGSAFENTDGAPIGNNEFTGLDFFRFGVHVFRLTSRQTTPFVIRNCRFLCCGWKAEGVDSPLYVDNVPVELTDCAFICCRNAARVCADTTVTSNVFRRCRFYVGGQNWNVRNAQPRAGCLAIGGTAWAHIDRCWFEKGQENDGGASGASLGSGLVLATSVNALVEDSVVYRNVGPSGCNAAGVVAKMSGNPTYTFNRCRFEKNRYSGKGCGDYGGCGCAVGVDGTGRLNFNDCAFIGNVVTNASATKPMGSVLGGHGDFCGNFANCTFEDNVSFGHSAYYTFASSWTSSKRFAFANCVFCNNRNGYLSDGTFVRNPEFRPLTFNEVQMYALVNTVLYNADSDYITFGTDWSGWANFFAFASCVSSSSQDWGTTGAGQFRYAPLDNETLAPLKDYTETNGVVIAHGIAEDSVYHKKGRPVYRAANGDLYIYDTVFNAAKPWRLLRNPGTVYTPEEGAAKGLSLDEPIADAFDKLRSKRKSDLGPIDFGRPGLMLFVK